MLLGQFTQRYNKSTIILVKPIPRQAAQFYDENLEEFIEHYERGCNKVKAKAVFCINTIPLNQQHYETDGVHLTPDAGKRMLYNIFEQTVNIMKTSPKQRQASAEPRSRKNTDEEEDMEESVLEDQDQNWESDDSTPSPNLHIMETVETRLRKLEKSENEIKKNQDKQT